ncbi:TlpA family protein disulfide reductase [Pseudomonas guariconensis]|uniref:TlpA family protein disulfide reductase n=1 Tax=Pseudomonas TaxID=286 RepID=UPI001CE492FD|nr:MULTISPECIES: TlpA family protein disulfide reductase [Pseudomonas]MCO7514841.1 TlpA family protein disulfide reductase [Pseudomonas putida]MCO7594838.1 TlpA family protein disulfide reductase [Pseudomonas guariconensis]MCO7606523.1 TlpA family protein disulfide reductase [Pseudomonas guariconensis]MCU7222357.1 TlpA family protein disulfide reductase [Pseudomonas brassicacearum]
MLTVTLGPLTMALNHLLLLAALGIASLVGWWVARRGGESPESALFNLFLLGLVFARLGFVLAYWPMYRDDPVQVIDIRDGGFLLWAGLIGIVLGTLWQGWRHPGLRRPLGWALFSGALFWGLASLGSHLYSKGTELPALSLRNATGQSVALHDYRGKPLVINLWATWCPPCRREMPVLQQAQHDYPQVTFLFVNQGETPENVSTFLATTGLSLTHVLFDGSGQLAQRVGSMALPTTLFYSAEGRLVGSHLGELSRASLRHALQPFERATAPSSAAQGN